MRALALVVSLIAFAACTEKAPPIDQAYVKQNLLTADPTPKMALNADLGGKVVYLGADVDKTSLKPGEKFTVVHYWKVVSPPGSEYRVFTHVEGGGKDWMNV